jgi:hypothetical protein
MVLGPLCLVRHHSCVAETADRETSPRRLVGKRYRRCRRNSRLVAYLGRPLERSEPSAARVGVDLCTVDVSRAKWTRRILNYDGRIGETIDQWRGGGESNSLRKIERQLKMIMTTRDKIIIGIAGIGVAILLVVALFSC